jgi:hypothetical protein
LALRGSTPKRTATSTDASNLVVVISLTKAAAFARSYDAFWSSLAKTALRFFGILAIFVD